MHQQNGPRGKEPLPKENKDSSVPFAAALDFVHVGRAEVLQKVPNILLQRQGLEEKETQRQHVQPGLRAFALPPANL